VAGAWLAHAMFALPILEISTHVRAGEARMLSEGAATIALLFAILGAARWRPDREDGEMIVDAMGNLVPGKGG